MELKKTELTLLTIMVEKPGSELGVFEEGKGDSIVAMFNPNRMTVSRTMQWQNQQSAKVVNPEMQFTGAEPAALSIDLLFDTWDTLETEAKKQSVKTLHVDKLLKLTVMDDAKHRPPLCRLRWGKQGIFFQGVLQQLETQYTMFTSLGVPVRATNRCSFKQWKANSSGLQNLMSADIAKARIVRRGETLATIAAAEYGDPGAWRLIAEANGLDDPLFLVPGTRLVLPALRNMPWAPRPGALS